MSKQVLHPLTEKINKKQKAKAKQLRADALRWLAKTFPKAFDDSTSIHPLKTGIMKDILTHAETASAGISITKLREAVIVFTRKIDYLTCLKAREMRIDLDGNPTVLVTEEEAAQAADKIKKHIDKCAKIAKQNAVEQSVPAAKSVPSSSAQLTQDSATYSSDMDYDHRFAATQTPARAATVVIKHKTNKPFDPDAVARLKEKLGLSRNI
jgi:ProP effector